MSMKVSDLPPHFQDVYKDLSQTEFCKALALLTIKRLLQDADTCMLNTAHVVRILAMMLAALSESEKDPALRKAKQDAIRQALEDEFSDDKPQDAFGFSESDSGIQRFLRGDTFGLV